MKVEVTNSTDVQAKESTEKYPCLKIHKEGESIIFFTAKETGVCLKVNELPEIPEFANPIEKAILDMLLTSIDKIGEYSSTWKEDRFKRMDKPFTFSNKDLGDNAYPKLKIHIDGTIVLFIKEKEGVCLKGEGGIELGKYHDGWIEHLFNIFHGTITLTND
jgi:hypothetical protein